MQVNTLYNIILNEPPEGASLQIGRYIQSLQDRDSLKQKQLDKQQDLIDKLYDRNIDMEIELKELNGLLIKLKEKC